MDEALVEVPDFLGYDFVNASYLASVQGLQISVNGVTEDGAVVSLQGVEPGEKVKQGTVISLTFAAELNTETYVTDLPD